MLRAHAESVEHIERRSPAAGFHMSDLISRIASDRDPEAFEELFEEYAPRIKGFLLRQGADQSTADDLVQETLLTIWRKASQYSASRGTLSTWVFTIARNLRIDRIRRQKPWREADDDLSFMESDEEPADEAVARGQMETRMRVAVSGLPPDQKEVIVLSYIEGLSQSDISARLDLPLGTVKSRMRLAYQRLRTSFEGLE